MSELNPQEGATAESEAEQARRDAKSALANGGLTLTGLFQMVEQESLEHGHRVIGHMHLRAALLACNWIGKVKAAQILEQVGLVGDRHLASLGSNEQAAIVAAVNERLPKDAAFTY